MKKIFTLSICLLVFARLSAQSPACTVNPNDTTDGIKPSSLSALAEVSYNQTVQFRFPKDTTLSFFGTPTKIKVDSIGITSVKGFPSSFNYQCGNADCYYKGGQSGCVLITGSPTNNQAGTYKLEVYFNAGITFESGLLSGTSTNFTDSGTITLTITQNSSIFYQSVSPNFEVSQNYPNPFNQNTEISFNSPNAQPAYISVTNELGQLVYTQRIQAIQGQNTYNFKRNNLPQGMYFYCIQGGDNMITRRMVIKD